MLEAILILLAPVQCCLFVYSPLVGVKKEIQLHFQVPKAWQHIRRFLVSFDQRMHVNKNAVYRINDRRRK